MRRKTRKEVQQQTRERLLKAAEEVIAARGIEAASLREISERAGYSLGAFYSNFPSKESMLQEILGRHMQTEMHVFRELLAGENGGSPAEILARVAESLKQLREDHILSGLVVEFHLYASRNPSFRAEFYASKALRMTELAEALKVLFERNGRELPIDPMLLAHGLSALWVGFAIQDEEGGGESAEQVVVLFLNALLNGTAPV